LYTSGYLLSRIYDERRLFFWIQQAWKCRFQKKTSIHLVTRDLWLIFLILTHISLYYGLSYWIKVMAIIPAVVSGLIWLVVYINLLGLARKASRDTYLKKAFGDEFLKNILNVSGHHGFIGMAVAAVIFLFLNLILNVIGIYPDIPMMITSELLILAGIITSDLSKIIQIAEV
jgi:hypothetical protein